MNKSAARKMFLRRFLQRWRVHMNRCKWIRMLFSAVIRCSKHRCVNKVFHEWRCFALCARFEEKMYLKFAFSTWLRYTRIATSFSLIRKQIQLRRIIKVFEAWKTVRDSARFAPVFKAHAYAAAASRRFATNLSPGAQGAPASLDASACQIPWRF